MNKREKYLLLFLMIIWMVNPGYSQEEQILEDSEEATPGKVTLNVGADLVSRYIWRGQNFGSSAAIQPTLSVDAFGFSLGAWGSYAFSRHTLWLNDSSSVDYNFSEIDLFLSYTYKYFTLMLVDFYAPLPIDTLPGANYFHWKNQDTYHTLEVSMIFNGPEKFPIQFLASTLVFGGDKGKDTSGVYGAGSKNNFSTYFELSYQFNTKGFGIKPFIGGIPFGSSWYGPKAGINNVGITVRKEIPVSRKFAIPIQSNLVFNPMSKKAYLVFILSL
ncbi:MAG: hypothetical protein HQ542_13920 [Bacteroidia bacterium]|nr:hypothetical protein [Bacteroidia bacterium]